MKLEILHYRDPDSECDLRVWADGVEVRDFSVVDVDPGRGYELGDWRESEAWDFAGASDGARPVVAAAYADGEQSPYVEGRDRYLDDPTGAAPDLPPLAHFIAEADGSIVMTPEGARQLEGVA